MNYKIRWISVVWHFAKIPEYSYSKSLCRKMHFVAIFVVHIRQSMRNKIVWAEREKKAVINVNCPYIYEYRLLNLLYATKQRYSLLRWPYPFNLCICGGSSSHHFVSVSRHRTNIYSMHNRCTVCVWVRIVPTPAFKFKFKWVKNTLLKGFKIVQSNPFVTVGCVRNRVSLIALAKNPLHTHTPHGNFSSKNRIILSSH